MLEMGEERLLKSELDGMIGFIVAQSFAAGGRIEGRAIDNAADKAGPIRQQIAFTFGNQQMANLDRDIAIFLNRNNRTLWDI